jgi:hypothetical protein
MLLHVCVLCVYGEQETLAPKMSVEIMNDYKKE